MEKNSYYDILGISQNASKEQIKTAFRQLALKYHPDKNANQNAGSIFIIINNAYHILINDQTRSEYDTFLNKERTHYTAFRYNNKKYNPIINKALSEFNYILWDIDDILRKITDKNIFSKINETNLYDYLLYFFKYLENEILNENDRFLNFAGKKDRIKLYLDIYFNLLRVEIDKSIISLELDIDNNTNKLSHMMTVKNEMIKYIGKIYEDLIFE